MVSPWPVKAHRLVLATFPALTPFRPSRAGGGEAEFRCWAGRYVPSMHGAPCRQATGRVRAWPLMATTPRPMDVPPALVRDRRTKGLKPR